MKFSLNPKEISHAFSQTIRREIGGILQDLRPTKPSSCYLNPGLSFGEFLLLEDSFEWPFLGKEENFTVFLMTDGALGVGLWLDPMSQEMCSEAEISSRLERLSEMFSRLKNPNLSLQVILDTLPDPGGDPPLQEWQESSSFASRMALHRHQYLSQLAHTPKGDLRLVKRRLLLTVRLSGKHPLADLDALDDRELERARAAFLTRVGELRDALSLIKSGVLAAQFSFRILHREECLRFFRDSLHSFSQKKTSLNRHHAPSQPTKSLREQVLYHSVQMTPGALGLGTGDSTDVWQAASLLNLPESTVYGLMAKLLKIQEPHRLVVNLRPVVKKTDLDTKRYLLKNADDAVGVRQREDITQAQFRLQREESLMGFSMHLLVLNESKILSQVEESGALRSVISQVTPILGGLWIEESLSAPLVFAACLPFQNSFANVSLVGRETRLLSKNVVALLPLYGGFRGTPNPLMQMVSRGGERLFLNPRDSQGASHLAVLGGSGSGKSFSMAHLVVSFRATYPRGRVFIIDKKTSYGVLALLAQEESKPGMVSFFNPPSAFPQIFSGLLNPDSENPIDMDRLPSLVQLLLTAISLLSPKLELGASHTRVLSDALLLTLQEKLRQSSHGFDPSTGGFWKSATSMVTLPRLSEVVHNLPSACATLCFSPSIARQLEEGLSPYVGSGPYASLFDGESRPSDVSATPLFTLCDLDGVSGDPVLLVLTVQAMILEILRLIKLGSSGSIQGGEPSLLLLEEVGVLASESPSLVTFIRDAWKTMRKFGVTCVGVTNEVSDYTQKPGPREIWNVSPHKLILPQNSSALAQMESLIQEGKNGLVPSLEHCALLGSLKMQKGEFAEGLWLGDPHQGTYVYFPTGFDYWCAASDPTEISSLKEVSKEILVEDPQCPRPLFEAVTLLARAYPGGVRHRGEVRALTREEVQSLVHALVCGGSAQEGREGGAHGKES